VTSASVLTAAPALAPLDRVVGGRRKVDAVTLLTWYAVVLLLVPATLIFTPLGQVGTPAIAVACFLLLWYLGSWISGNTTPSGAGRPVRIAMVVFSVAILLSFVAAMTRDITQEEVLAADSGLIWLATSIGLFLLASQAIVDYRRLDTLLRRLVILGCVVALIGVGQFFGFDLTKYMVIPGLSVNAAAVTNVLVRGGFTRPWSTTTQPIEFSVVLAMLLPFAIQQALDPGRTGMFRKWVPVAILALSIPLTVTRSGVLGAFVAVLCMFFTWSPLRQRVALVFMVFGLGAMHFVAGGLISTLYRSFIGVITGQDQNVQDRTADYAGVSQYIAQRPIFGRGFWTFIPTVYRYTDNMYLLSLVEIGIVGLAAMIILFLAGMYCARAGRRLTRVAAQRELGQALFASIAAATVTSATFDSLTFPDFSGLFFVILGCAGAYFGIMSAQAQATARTEGYADEPPTVELASIRRRRGGLDLAELEWAASEGGHMTDGCVEVEEAQVVPLVDVKAGHEEVAEEIRLGFDRVLARGSFIKGAEVAAFEREYAEFTGVAHCVGVANGTDALELALRAIGLPDGAEVVLPANTFIATAEAVVRAGGRPAFADVDSDYLLADPASVKSAVGDSTRAFVPVHLYGQMAPMSEIVGVAAAHNIPVVEDAAQAHGASQDGYPAGSFGLLAGVSFYPGKNLGAYGDAGAVLTHSAELADRVRLLGDHGSKHRYEHVTIGFNSRLDELQAVVLRAKLPRLAAWNEARRTAAQRYNELLADVEEVTIPQTMPGNEHVWHLYVIRIPRRDHVARWLADEGVQAAIHYPHPVHLQPAFRSLGYGPGDFPVAESAAREILSLPLYPQITAGQQRYVVKSLCRALSSPRPASSASGRR
jgi:dTDP-4-amino-4,6-dideoxygalactose transaminase/O-antigen ligase